MHSHAASEPDVQPVSKSKALGKLFLEGFPTLTRYLQPDFQTASPLAISAAAPAFLFPSPSVGEMSKKAPREHYPWKQEIVTTTFWVGEAPTKRNPVPNHASSWDPRWAHNYGGTDDPDPSNRSRSQFIPVKFTPRQNPFYCALPYNDVERGKTKPEASKVIPWFKTAFKRSGKSVLKDRWIAIRYNGRTAYAQWEDSGPFRTDHWEYVFGTERPKKNLNKGAGLDVSPAVRDFLGMNDTDVTDWRFVDFDEVPSGPWEKFGDNNTFVLNARSKNIKTVLATGLVE